MQQPVVRHVGDRWVQLRNGVDEVETRLISETYATHTFRNTDECTVTRRKGTRFTPYVSWICPSGNGTNTVTKNGNPWPLEVGKEWSYDVSGKDGDGAQWSYELECEVEDTAIVETALGVHNTYRVACSHKWGTQTIYMAPQPRGAGVFRKRGRRQQGHLRSNRDGKDAGEGLTSRRQ